MVLLNFPGETAFLLLPQKLACSLKRDHFKRNLVFQLAFFQCFFRGYQGVKVHANKSIYPPATPAFLLHPSFDLWHGGPTTIIHLAKIGSFLDEKQMTSNKCKRKKKQHGFWTQSIVSVLSCIYIYIYINIDHKYDAPNMSAAHVEQRSNDLLYVQFNKLSLHMCHQARLELWTPQNSSWKLEVTRLKRKRIF